MNQIKSMNEDYVVRAYISGNLEDALEELSRISDSIRPNAHIDEGDFNVRMAHLYGHLNQAWNVRNLSSEDLDNADSHQLNLWNQFPVDLKPI